METGYIRADLLLHVNIMTVLMLIDTPLFLNHEISCYQQNLVKG